MHLPSFSQLPYRPIDKQKIHWILYYRQGYDNYSFFSNIFEQLLELLLSIMTSVMFLGICYFFYFFFTFVFCFIGFKISVSRSIDTILRFFNAYRDMNKQPICKCILLYPVLFIQYEYR